MDEPELLIKPGRGSVWSGLVEAWRGREVLLFLGWRDVKVRYKQTALGAAWAILQPLVTMLVFTLVFNRVAGIESGEVPYPVFAYAGLLPWLLFQSAVTGAGNSMVAEVRMLTRVYLPRLLVPLAAMVSGLADFCVAFTLLIVLMAIYGLAPTAFVLLVPVFVLLTVLTALSIGVWLAALNVRYRDFRYVIPFVLSTWMFLSPVAYPAEQLKAKLPEGWGWVYELNPMTGVLEGMRWALLGSGEPPVRAIAVSTCAMLILLAGGLVYFREMERTYADRV